MTPLHTHTYIHTRAYVVAYTQVFDEMVVTTYRNGSTIFAAGGGNDTFFVLESGCVLLHHAQGSSLRGGGDCTEKRVSRNAQGLFQMGFLP